MQLQLQTFGSLVGAASAAVQGTARQLVDLTVGSTLRAMLEASASIALWVQWLIVQVLETTRASTSAGADLDSWMADFSVARLPAVAAAGTVTFGRFTTIGTAVVPTGTEVRTADGGQSFVVLGATGMAGFSAALNGYPMAAGVSAVNVPVRAVVPGLAGNVQAGAVTLIAAALSGVDTVGNDADFAGGLDAEDDAAFRARFAGFMASLARATPAAIAFGIASVQQGLRHVVLENVLPDGTPRVGSFVVVVDDGTGAPSSSLVAAVAASVERMRPVGASYTVRTPDVVSADVALAVDVAAGFDAGAEKAAVVGAVRSHLDAMGLGQGLAWSRLVQVAHDASPAVTRVSAVQINGATADLAVAPGGLIRAGAVVVN